MKRPSLRWLSVAPAVLAVSWAGCQNAGEGHVLGVVATGVVNGVVYLDRNGNHVLDATDTALVNLPVRLVAQGTSDTVAKGSSGSSASSAGTFRFVGVPVGSYSVVIDTTLLGDSLRIVRVDTAAFTLRPNDTLTIRIAVSFPQLTIAQARVAAPGRKMFVVGVALNTRGIFGDTTVHLADPTGAIRMTAVRTIAVAVGDSVRVFGTRSTRDGQPTLNQVTAFSLAFDAETPVTVVNTAAATSANSGQLDAALIKIVNAGITDTATVQGNRRLTLNDGSGALEVQLDSAVGFRGAVLAGDTIGAKADVAGLLLPGTPGVWKLQPRAPSDLTLR